MAFVNSGTQRTLNISVLKTGNDNSSETILLDGKLDFGAYDLITTDQMQKLSDVDFAARVDAWKLDLQSTYATSDTNLWTDISASFKYVNGVVVRLISLVNKQYAITTYPIDLQESISMVIEDPYENDLYTLTIGVGFNLSNVITLKEASTSTDQDIESINSAEFAKSKFGTFLYYKNYCDLGVGIPIQYPLPV